MSRSAAAPVPRRPGGSSALGRGAAASVAGEVASLVIGYTSAIIIARMLNPSGRGVLSVIQYGALAVTSLTAVGTQVGVQYYAGRRPRRIPQAIGNQIVFGLVLTAVLMVSVGPLLPVLRHLVVGVRGVGVWYAAALLVPTTMLDYTATGLLAVERRFGRASMVTVLGRLATLTTAPVMIGYFGWGVAGAITALIISQAVGVIGSFAKLLRHGIGLSRHLFVASVRWGARSEIGNLAQMLNARFDTFVLGYFAAQVAEVNRHHAYAQIGLYTVGQTVAELVLIFPRNVGFTLMPMLSSGLESKELAARAARFSATASLFGVVLVAAVAPALVLIGYGHDFAPALLPLYLLLPGTWSLSLGQLGAWLLRGRGRPGVTSTLSAIEILITVGLDLLLIPRYGIVGAAIASSIAYTVFGLSTTLVIARLESVPVRQLLICSRSELRQAAAMARDRLLSLRAGRAAP